MRPILNAPVKFQHTATRRWLPGSIIYMTDPTQFQHTATRRWLLLIRSITPPILSIVSTHSHPKVAAIAGATGSGKTTFSFNTQPPEGGCSNITGQLSCVISVSTHSHPKVAAKCPLCSSSLSSGFNTQPPEGGCSLHKKARKISVLNTVFR